MAVYHRRESRTQTRGDARKQESSGEIWGKTGFGRSYPSVKAVPGPLPPSQRGIEFETDIPPNRDPAPDWVEWSGPREGVVVEGEFAKIKVTIRKNSQA